MNESIVPIQGLLPHAVSDRLREMIVEGRLEPGAKINERALCEAFGVSRTPLREAMQALAKEGLIQLIPRRGARVAPMTVEDLDEVFPIMGALEGLAAELAAARMTAAEIAAIRTLTDEMVAAHARGDLPDYFHLNEEIHERIFLSAGNETLMALRRALSARVRRARFRANLSPERWRQAVEEHARIVEALEARDGPRIGAMMKDHIAHKLSALRASLAAAPEG